MLPKRITSESTSCDPADPSQFNGASPVAACPGWERRIGFLGNGARLVRWQKDARILLDVMNPMPDRLLGIEVDDVPDQIRPLAGRGYSNGHPGEAKIEESAGDVVVRKWLAKNPVDHLLTHEGGSPRESGLDAIARLALREGGLSAVGRNYLGAFTEAQLNRPYQDPDDRGFPSGLTGIARVESKGAGANAFLGLPYWAAHCPCHFTVDRLATAWELTGNPRALDQLIRLMVHALRTEYYLELEADQFGRVGVNGFYASAPRMIGWPLVAIARTLGVLRRAAKIDEGGAKLAALLGPQLKAFGEAHIANVLKRWGLGIWSPFATTDGTGGHTTEKHDVVFMECVLAMGARRCAEFGLFGAAELAHRCVEWIDSYGWARSNPNAVMLWYDALEAGGGTSPRSPWNGVGLWTIQAVSGTGTELERRLIEEARETNFGGAVEIDSRNSLFPLLEWSPDAFNEAVRGTN